MRRCDARYRFAAQLGCAHALLPWAGRGSLNSRELPAVPIARYFAVVGSGLVVLLLIAGWFSPEPPPSFADRPEIIERAIIRIRSERKWPERVVLDTSQPTIAPPAVEEPSAAQSVRLSPYDVGDQPNLEALARLKPDTPSAAVDHRTLRIKRGSARNARSKRVARGPVTRRLARAEAGWGCCQIGWIDNGQTSSNAMSRRHAASSRPMDWPAFTGRN
jgi:hypothetical protein